MDYTNSYMPHAGGYPQDFGSGPAEHQYKQHYEQASSSVDQQGNPYVTQGVPQHITCDIKPRLTKEQHDILETHFQSQPKPNTSTKKGFAESLNVSLDKVNNWFQNRRAKSKQDAKKQNGALHILNAHHSSHQFSLSGSDSEPSPAFSSPDYFNMMQQCTADDSHANKNHGLPHYSQQYEEQDQFPMEMSYSGSSDDQFQNFGFEHGSDMFDSPQDLNRRTLTQEQFDALSHHQGVVQPSGGFNAYEMDPETYKLLTDFSQDEIKPQEAFAFHSHVGIPMPSHDSSVPSTSSDRSTMSFPSSHAMQEHNASSSVGSDWTGSRSSSISTSSRDEQFVKPIVAPQPQQPVQTSRWQPGQSVPVDPNQLSREFQQARHARQSSQQFQTEHPLAWPNDDAFHQQRSESQTRMITHSMSNVGIHTPQPQQNATFKSPTPASSLASRRQRARPAPLGLASMRSQSYSGVSQPDSPGHLQQQPHLNPGQQIRRIKSNNVVGGVVQGRIQKQLPGSAQRSPLTWTFSDSVNSPKALRHVSSQSGSNLAPPTPMSPKPEQQRPVHQWQSSYGHVARQASISESDLEQQGLPYVPSGSAPPPQNFSSPPHTPLYPPQPQFAQQWINGNAITENTPPQSAPASQQCFPSHTFAPPPQSVHHQPPPAPQSQPLPPPPPPQQAMQHMFSVQPEPQRQMPAEQNMQMVAMSMPPQPQFTITSSAPMEMPMQWPAGSIPFVDTNGQIQLAIPHPHYQYTQHPLTQPPHTSIAVPPSQPHQMVQYPYSASTSPGIQVTAQVPRQPAQPQPEFFVHEYHPPEDVKRAATPRKTPVDTTPKNYTFANQGPEHFEKGKKADKASTTAGSSPASTSGGISSS